MIDRPRIVRFAEAAADLLVARDALQRASIAMGSIVNADDDPAWNIWREAEALSKKVEPLRITTVDLVWHDR